jgi:hypothetical protein
MFIIAAFIAWSGAGPAGAYMLSAGDGLYFCENSTTFGKRNIWLNLHGRGFYWDDPDPGTGGMPVKIFPCAGADMGLLSFIDAGASMEVLSYGFTVPGNLKVRTKITTPFNKRIRPLGAALSCTYTLGLLDHYPSLGGYRNRDIGFYAEGIYIAKNQLEFKFIGDIDFIRLVEFLPFKIYVNIGYRMPVNRDYDFYDQYLFTAGLEYKGLTTDYFVEGHMEVLRGPDGQNWIKNGFYDRITVSMLDRNGYPKIFPYHFNENPMYVSPGIRLKYKNGIAVCVAAPILLSREVGFTIKTITQAQKDSVGEPDQPWTDGYSPFYTDWKICGKISVPIRFKSTPSEMVRKFIFLKRRGEKPVLDIDEAISKKKEMAPRKRRPDRKKEQKKGKEEKEGEDKKKDEGKDKKKDEGKDKKKGEGKDKKKGESKDKKKGEGKDKKKDEGKEKKKDESKEKKKDESKEKKKDESKAEEKKTEKPAEEK